MNEKKFNAVKSIFVIVLYASILLSVGSIIDCCMSTNITPWRHVLLLLEVIIDNLIFLFIVKKTTLADSCKKIKGTF